MYQPQTAAFQQMEAAYGILMPLNNFHGVANLNYEVTDGQASTPCVAVIIIAPVTHAPVASFVKLEAQKNKAIKFTKSQLLGSSYDEDSDPLDVINVYATKGTITDHGDDTWTYMPMANFSGMITLNFSITDGFYTAPSQALVNVTTINHAPVTSRVTLFATQDSSIIISNSQLIGSSYDLDGDEMLAINVSTSDGKVIDNEDLTWTYIPHAGFVGKATLNFRVSDGRLSTPSSAIVNVRELNTVLGSMTSAYKQYIEADKPTQDVPDDKPAVLCKPTP
jgi:large repetitive protein